METAYVICLGVSSRYTPCFRLRLYLLQTSSDNIPYTPPYYDLYIEPNANPLFLMQKNRHIHFVNINCGHTKAISASAVTSR